MHRLRRHQTILATLATTGFAQTFLAVSGIGAARILGADNRGKLALFNLLPTLLVLVGTLGLPVAITYFIARDPTHARSTIRPVARLCAGLAVLLTAIDAAALGAIEHGQPTYVLIAAGVSVPLVVFSILQVLGNSILQGRQRYKAFNWCRTLPILTYAVGVAAIFITHTGSLLVLTCVYVGTTAIVAVFTWWMAVRDLPPRTDSTTPPPSVREMRSFGLRAVLGAVYPTEAFQLDQASVGLFLPSASLGLYVIAVSFTNLPRFVAQSFGVIAYPRVAATKDPAAARRLVVRYALGAAIVTLPICVVLEVSVGFLIPFVYGRNFSGAVSVTRILLIASFIVSVRRILADGLRGAGYPTIGTAGEGVALAVLLPLLVVLISVQGLHGAAIAVCVSSAAGLAVIGIFCWRLLRHPGRASASAMPFRFARGLRRSQPGARRQTAGVLAVAALLSAALGASMSLLRMDSAVLLISGTALALLVPIVVRTLSGGFDPFEPCLIFALSYGVMFVARPIAILSSHNYAVSFAGTSVDFSAAFNKMLLLGLIGAVAFAVGYLSFAGRRLAAGFPSPPARSNPQSLFRAGNMCGVLGCILFGIFASSGGFSATIHLLTGGRSLALTQAYRSSSSYFSGGDSLLIPGVVLLLAVGVRFRHRKAIVLGLVWLALFLAIQIPLGDRTQLLPLLGGLLILPYLMRKTRPRAITLVIVGFIAVFCSALLGASRSAAPQAAAAAHSHSISSNFNNLVHHPNQIFKPILQGADGAEAPDLAAALTVVPSQLRYTWGASTIGDFFTRMIPRLLWPGKPLIPRGRVIQRLWGQAYYYGAANPEFSVLLYPYMDAGIVGVVVLMALFGLAASTAFEYMKLHADNFAVVITFAIALPLVVEAVRDSPVDIAARAAFVILPLFLAFRAASGRGAPSAAAADDNSGNLEIDPNSDAALDPGSHSGARGTPRRETGSVAPAGPQTVPG